MRDFLINLYNGIFSEPILLYCQIVKESIKHINKVKEINTPIILNIDNSNNIINVKYNGEDIHPLEFLKDIDKLKLIGYCEKLTFKTANGNISLNRKILGQILNSDAQINDISNIFSLIAIMDSNDKTETGYSKIILDGILFNIGVDLVRTYLSNVVPMPFKEDYEIKKYLKDRGFSMPDIIVNGKNIYN